MFVILFTSLFISNVFFQIFEDKRLIFFLNIVFTTAIYFLSFYGVTETADSSGYEFVFKHPEIKIEFVFRELSDYLFEKGYQYILLFKLHIIVIGVLFIKFISRFTTNIFLIFGYFILLNYVPLANQIRYFLSLSLFLNGLYSLYVSKNKIAFGLYSLLAVLSHYYVPVLFLFLFFNRTKNDDRYIRKLSIYGFIGFLVVFMFFITGFLSSLLSLTLYFNASKTSSILGGVYNCLPYAIILFFMVKRHKGVLDKHPILQQDIKFHFLYRLSLFPILFLPASLYAQILAHRFCFPFLLIWLIYFIYPLKNKREFTTIINYIAIISVVMIGMFYYYYFFSNIILGHESHYFKEFIRTFNSVNYI